MEILPPYQYSPLDLREEIRLLVLNPSGIKESSSGIAIECSLIHVLLANKPTYQALSYRWGDNTEMRQLIIDGKTIRVSENLWLALWNILAHDRARVSRGWIATPRCLWVDAICINQSDITERNHQVGIMSQIYSKAEEVAVWLGSGDEGTNLAMETLRHLEKTEAWESLQNDTEDRWLELRRLFENEYFSRMWIVQEVILARRLMIYCGSKRVDWRKLNYLQKHLKYVTPNIRPNWQHVEAIFRNQAMELDRNRIAWEGRNTHLAQLLEACQFCQCYDPRDKVFSLLGFASDCQNNELSADYSKSLFKVYEDVVCFWYSHREFNPIVPHFTVRLSQMLQKSFMKPVQMEEEALKARAAITSNLNHLFRVAGIWCGRVSMLGPSFKVKDSQTTSWASPANPEDLPRNVKKFLLEHLGRAKEITSQSSFANVWYQEPLTLRRSFGHIRRSLSRSKILLGSLKTGGSEESVPPAPEEGFCFFETANGFLGIGPQKITPDDLICQFSDCNVAALLREQDTLPSRRWLVIGSVVIFNKSGARLDIPGEYAQFKDWAVAACDRDIAVPFSSPSHAHLPSLYVQHEDVNGESHVVNGEPDIRLYLDIFALQELTRYYAYDANSNFIY